MRIDFPGFVGPTYQAASRAMDIERCINIYPEPMPPGLKGRGSLLPTPGLAACPFFGFNNVPANACRGMFSQDGRAWFIAGNNLFEFVANTGGTTVAALLRGVVKNDGKPVYFACNGRNGKQLMLTSGGNGYVFDLTWNDPSNVLGGFQLITSSSFPQNLAAACAYMDGYAIVLLSNTNQFIISALNDVTTWSGLNLQAMSEGSDNCVAMGVSGRGVWFLGSKSTEVWYDSGQQNTPFQPIPGVFIEIGIAAIGSLVTQFDNTIIWLAQNASGGLSVRKANGYVPERVSTYALEAIWDSYAVVSDAVGWTYSEEGHEFYVLNFPTANATFVYDATTNMWHERAWLNPATGALEAQKQIYHCFFANEHLVGSRLGASVYVQDINFVDDAGDELLSIRRTPYIGKQNLWNYHHSFELEFERGVGLSTGQGSDPKCMLRWSDDGATWSNSYTATLGKIGDYAARAIWRRLDRARWRVYEVSVSDPVRRAWVNAYVDVTEGTS